MAEQTRTAPRLVRIILLLSASAPISLPPPAPAAAFGARPASLPVLKPSRDAVTTHPFGASSAPRLASAARSSGTPAAAIAASRARSTPSRASRSPSGAKQPSRAVPALRRLSLNTGGTESPSASPLMQLWLRGRFRGANAGLDASPGDLRDLAAWGANVARVLLTEDTIDTEPPYLLKEAGLRRLDRFLDAAREAGLGVIVGFRAAPGRIAVSDRRLWEIPECHLAFARQWREVASRYRGSTTVVGFDLLSEPDPELLFEGAHRDDLIAGTTADWNLLARRLTYAIREVDPGRPLIVETGSWAYAKGFAYLRPTGDPHTLYSFHMFSPRNYTHQTPDRPVSYPGVVAGHVEPDGFWDYRALKANLKPAIDFQRRHNVPILVGEFGPRRTAADAGAYLRDLLRLFEEAGWHWTFWRFRETSDWNPEIGPDPRARAAGDPTTAPLLRLYREFLSLNDHPFYLQDLPLLKDPAWVSPMRSVRRAFTGRQGTVGLFGDSITYGRQFFGPLFQDGYAADAKTLADLRRFRDIVPFYVGDWKTERYGNKGGWKVSDALPGLGDVLRESNPEIAFVMFGTNDLSEGMPEGRNFEAGLREYTRRIAANGTVPVLWTIPPRKDVTNRVDAYNEVIRRVARELTVPLVDYHGAVVRRRADWYRTLIIGDGIHPSFPEAYQKDFTERGLRESGFTLRNYLALQAALSVLDRLRE